MHTDTYYRGYRLAEDLTTGRVALYYGTDRITEALNVAAARTLVDTYQDAR